MDGGELLMVVTVANVLSLEEIPAILTVGIAGETFPNRIELRQEKQWSSVPDRMKRFSNSKTLPFRAGRCSSPDPVKTQRASNYTLHLDPICSRPVSHLTTCNLPDIRGHGVAGLPEAYRVAIGPSNVSLPHLGF